MSRKLLLSLGLIAILLLSSCAANSFEAEAPMASPEEYYVEEAVEEARIQYDDSSVTHSNVNAAAVERIIIKNASLTIVVSNPAAVMEIIGKDAEAKGGFIVNSNLYKTYSNQGVEIPEANITVRVPSEQLLESIEKYKELTSNPDEDVLNEYVSGQDVTKEYTDLQSRLKNLEQAAEKLEEIMEDAIETEDVLSVYNELTYVTEEIELIKGQIKYYEESARLSSIDVTIMAHEAYQPISIGGWEPAGVAKNAVQALIDTLQFFSNAAIWFAIYLLPVLLCLAIPFWLVWIGFRKIRQNRKIKKSKKESEENSAIDSESSNDEKKDQE